MGDDSQRLELWSSLGSLQTAGQNGQSFLLAALTAYVTLGRSLVSFIYSLSLAAFVYFLSLISLPPHFRRDGFSLEESTAPQPTQNQLCASR